MTQFKLNSDQKKEIADDLMGNNDLFLGSAPTSESVTEIETGRKELTGSSIIEDELKPLDFDDHDRRESTNKRFSQTLGMRAGSEKATIAIIQTRVHEDDIEGLT